MNASQASSTRELPVLQEREVWIVVEKTAPIDTAVYRHITPGSAIVAAPMLPGTDYVKIYFEGNFLRAANQHCYEERLVNCWGRLVYRYPTIAMMGNSVAEFLDRYDIVGTYNGQVMNLFEGAQERLAEVQMAYEEFWKRPRESAGGSA